MDKANQLFLNYDVDLSCRLSMYEIDIMLDDITSIILDYLPALAIILKPSQNKEILHYKRCLVKLRRSINDNFQYLITRYKATDLTN